MGNYDYYKSRILETAKVEIKLRKARTQFCRNLLVVSGSLFGILVSLHRTTETNLPARLSFFLSLLLLGLGILSIAISLFLDIDIQEHLKKERLDEIQQAMCENREVRHISYANGNRVFVWFEKIGYILLILSVLSLCVYEFFVSFPDLFIWHQILPHV